MDNQTVKNRHFPYPIRPTCDENLKKVPEFDGLSHIAPMDEECHPTTDPDRSNGGPESGSTRIETGNEG